MRLTHYCKQIIPKLLAFLIVCCPLVAEAQLPSLDEMRVTLPAGSITLSEAFRTIERQTPFRFAFTGEKLDASRKIDLPKTDYTVTELVDHLLSGTGHTYTRRQMHFVVIPEPPQPRQQPVVATPPRPIIIADRELRQFAPEEQRGADSVTRQTTEAGPFRFGATDQVYSTPGNPFPEGEVPRRFETSQRWQRSKFALKTNLLYGGVALAPNLHVEIGLSNRSTLELGGSINAWNRNGTLDDNKKLTHGIVMAEYRYWLCERFSGHFFGVHALGAAYNVGGYDIPLLFDKEFRYEGTAYGGGISYGYMLPLSKRWSIEFNVGLGVASMDYDKYSCDKCEDKIDQYNKTYFGPTRAGITLVFIIK